MKIEKDTLKNFANYFFHFLWALLFIALTFVPKTPLYFAINLYTLSTFLCFFYLWSLNFKLSLGFTVWLFGLFHIASELKFNFLASSVLAMDYYAVKNALYDQSIFAQYGFSGFLGATSVLGTFLCFFWLLLKIPRQVPKAKLLKFRVGSLLLFVIFTSSLRPVYGNIKEGNIAMGQRFYLKYGSVPLLLSSLLTLEVKIPPRTSTDIFLEEQRKLLKQDLPIESKTTPPDIFIWLNESVFDPHLLEEGELANRSLWNFFKKSPLVVARGFSRVPVWGGGTWLSELAAVSTLSYEEFGPSGFYAPYTLSHRINYLITDDLKRAGYHTLVLYPVGRNFFNAETAYKNYGFDEFFAAGEFGDPSKQGRRTDDLWLAKAMFYEVDRIKKRVKKPLFVFLLTMRNHGPHGKKHHEKSEISDGNEPAASESAPLNMRAQLKLSDYLSRLQNTKEAHDFIESQLLKRKSQQDILFASFGDHQPSFEGAMGKMKKNHWGVDPKWLTFYLIKSNFPSKYHSQSYPILDLTFLSPWVLQLAGLSLSEKFQANADLRVICDGLYSECKKKGMYESYQSLIHHTFKTLK